jgi:uncharacterized protein (TIGR03067 family)
MILLAMVFSLILGQTPEQTKSATEDLKKLQGSWRLVGGSEPDVKISADDAKKEGELYNFKDDTLVVRSKGKVVLEGTISVKPGKDFGEMDFKHTGGQYEGKTCHAIYVLDGDDLKICTVSKLRSDEPEDRPTVFSTEKSNKEGEKHGKLLLLLKREKK